MYIHVYMTAFAPAAAGAANEAMPSRSFRVMRNWTGFKRLLYIVHCTGNVTAETPSGLPIFQQVQFPCIPVRVCNCRIQVPGVLAPRAACFLVGLCLSQKVHEVILFYSI